MTARVFLRSHIEPLPDNPLGWCSVCVAVWKADGQQKLLPEIKAAAASDQEVVYLDMPDPSGKNQVFEAVAWGLYGPWTMIVMGAGGNAASPFPMPLCVTHLMGVDMADSSLQQATDADAAMLRQMEGNAILLDPQGRVRG